MTASLPAFSDRLIDWATRNGRHNLPWQQARSAYRVWVSEIMLQQTQVGTVIGYFERFMTRFPSIQLLASASEDEVLHLWSGLGYYSRARNLRKAAQVIVQQHAGGFPTDIQAAIALPGIGPSTAGAILSMALGQSHAILDGNVKRVLSRHQAVEGWPGQSTVTRTLWGHARAFTPNDRAGEYTQAIMDLGATVCTRRNPACLLCPVAGDCKGLAAGDPQRLPAPRPKRERATRSTQFLIVRNTNGEVLLRRRPAVGVWAGLWGFPEFDNRETMTAWCAEVLGIGAKTLTALPTVHHGFTHFELHISVWLAEETPARQAVGDVADELWCNPSALPDIGLAAPVSKLLQRLSPDTPQL